MSRWQRDQQLAAQGAALRAQRARICALMEENEERDRRERALVAALRELEQRLAKVEARAAYLERERALARVPRRLPLARAAQRLGISRDHVLRLGRQGLLDLADMREKGAVQALWTVSEAHCDALLAARRADPARIADPEARIAGQRAKSNGG